MADTSEMQDIRGLDIDKTVKGFALTEFIFKQDCNQSTTTADSIRWYQETSTDLTATTPATISNVSPLSTPAVLEASWTRNTSYVRKYFVESPMISLEDIKGADIDVIARNLLRLTRAIVKQVDTRIYNVLTENDTPVNIQTFATTAVGGDQWDAASYAGNPLKDILHCKYLVENYGYDSSSATLYVSPIDARNIMDWLIAGKGSSIPAFSSEKVRTGVLMNLLGVTIKVSPNVSADKAVFFIPQTSATWKSHTSITSRIINEEGVGSKIRVWEIGEAILTDPKSVVLITDTQT